MVKSILKRVWCRVFGDSRWRFPGVDNRVLSIYELFRQSLDITAMPRARGPLRVIQAASATMLKQVADVFESHGIRYSLCGGTLLGAVRHRGFIPWDDDIDVAVLAEDYLRVEKLLEEKFTAEAGFRVVRSTCIRIIMEGAPCQVDVFPFEIHRVQDDGLDGRMAFSAIRDRLMSMIQVDWDRLKTDARVTLNPEIVPEVIRQLATYDSGDKKILLTGCDTCNRHYPPLKYDWVFPLGKVRFEGFEFSAPAKPDIVLVNYFGDYMRFPNSFCGHDDIMLRFSIEAYEKMLMYVRANNSESRAAELLEGH